MSTFVTYSGDSNDPHVLHVSAPVRDPAGDELSVWENEGGALAREVPCQSPELVRVLQSYMDLVERHRHERFTDLTSERDQRRDELMGDLFE